MRTTRTIFVLGMAVLTAAVAHADPVEHRLSPEEAAAAVDAGAERNRAAEALALARTDPALALPGEGAGKPDKKVHGEVGVGFGSNGERELFGQVNTQLGDSATASFAYDYSQFGRSRYRSR